MTLDTATSIANAATPRMFLFGHDVGIHVLKIGDDTHDTHDSLAVGLLEERLF